MLASPAGAELTLRSRYSSIKKLRSPPSKRGVPSIISGAPGARANPSPLPPAAKAHTEPSKLEWAAPLPPPSDSTSTELNAPAPPSALLQLPSSTRRTSSSAPAPPSLAPQKRKATTSSPSSPARRTRSVTSDRPLRAVRIPPKLSSEGYAGTEREAEEEDAHEEAMFEVGSAVMAKFPSYSWWCAIVSLLHYSLVAQRDREELTTPFCARRAGPRPLHRTRMDARQAHALELPRQVNTDRRRPVRFSAIHPLAPLTALSRAAAGSPLPRFAPSPITRCSTPSCPATMLSLHCQAGDTTGRSSSKGARSPWTREGELSARTERRARADAQVRAMHRLAEWAKELTDSDIARTTEAMKKRRGSREMKED